MGEETERVRLNGTPAHEIRSVLISVPADPAHVVLVRSAAGRLGSTLGYTAPEIQDLRLAVDEACGIFLASNLGPWPHPDLRCRFWFSGWGLRFEVSGRAAGVTEPDTGTLGWRLLRQLVDAVSWHNDGTTASFALEKRRRPERFR